MLVSTKPISQTHIHKTKKKCKSSITNPTLVVDVDGVGGSYYRPKLKEKKSKTPKKTQTINKSH